MMWAVGVCALLILVHWFIARIKDWWAEEMEAWNRNQKDNK